MIKTFLVMALAVLSFAPAANAAPEIGKPAPAFTGTDSKGKSHSLSDYKGKIVVLEWTNPGCPFVKKHYNSHNMQNLQKGYTAKDIVWLSINSGAEGNEGFQTASYANRYMEDQSSAATARLLDPKGEIGHLYGAKVTPHMFVIDKDGMLVYEGAIDDNDSNDAEDIATSKNYVAAALDSIMAGKPVETTQTKPYGCGVKY